MSALDTQVGGNHYVGGEIQPVEFIEANQLGFLEGCVVKRVTRHDRPGGKGRQDIEKAIHELQLLLELRYSGKPQPEPLTGAAIGSIGPHADRYAGVGSSPIGKYAGYAPAMPSTLRCGVCEAWPCQCRVMTNGEGPHDPYSRR